MIISSIFGKTKPINFVLIIAYMILFFFISFYFYFEGDKSLLVFLNKSIGIGILILSVFLIDFIAKKNNLSRNNSYLIFLFAVFISMFPQIFMDVNSVISNCAVLLAARKCLSLKSQIDIKRKIFDASFFVGIATLFHNWALLVLIMVFISIVLYGSKDFKNWLIPFVALLSIAILVFSFLIMKENLAYLGELLSFDSFFKIGGVNDLNYLIPFVFTMGIGFISLMAFFIKIKAKTSKTQASIFLTTILLIVGIAIALLSGDKGGAEFLFIAFPLAVIVTNYLELIMRDWYKESILWVFLLIPLLLLLF